MLSAASPFQHVYTGWWHCKRRFFSNRGDRVDFSSLIIKRARQEVARQGMHCYMGCRAFVWGCAQRLSSGKTQANSVTSGNLSQTRLCPPYGLWPRLTKRLQPHIAIVSTCTEAACGLPSRAVAHTYYTQRRNQDGYPELLSSGRPRNWRPKNDFSRDPGLQTNTHPVNHHTTRSTGQFFFARNN